MRAYASRSTAEKSSLTRLSKVGSALLVAAALGLCGCGGGGGGSDAVVVSPPPAPPPPAAGTDQPLVDATVYSSLPGASLASATEAAAITHHQMVVGGTTLTYTATTGHLVARDLTTDTPQASFFYVAYTLDGQNAAQRPITFFYNGGPGSASVWLHLGSYGPKRIVTGFPSTSATAFPLVDNSETLLDVSDLVFVDAIGTGYSQAIAPKANRSFWGVDVDAAAFRDFIRRYVEANGRTAAPKFLFGESYGTTRSAVLAGLMETAGMPLAGVVLQSSILDYRANCAVVVSPQRSCAGFLPTYSATGAWYALLNPNPAELPPFLEEMRVFTRDTYGPAVATWLSSGAPPAAGVLNDLVDRTGLALARWQERFNMGPGTFQQRLFADTLIGRYDSRVSAPVGDPLAREGDPSSTFITAPFSSALGAYLADTLKYTSPSTYVLSGSAINFWDFSHDGRSLPDTIPDLATALALNARLRVLSVSGYHDLATPFHQTELDLARLDASARISIRNYAGGHMTYLDDAARVAGKADLQAFYRAAIEAQNGARE